ncbi:L-lactate dehydrogenase [Striga asiatica]|uniref:L-lactate dehydrogenase n=1 Tax=Striga asiatica TaxID=4170 RepID=A0A5A7PIK3_STRAF|nr:L-lactate dehydrogenase [Striga asiatica]
MPDNRCSAYTQDVVTHGHFRPPTHRLWLRRSPLPSTDPMARRSVLSEMTAWPLTAAGRRDVLLICRTICGQRSGRGTLKREDERKSQEWKRCMIEIFAEEVNRYSNIYIQNA